MRTSVTAAALLTVILAGASSAHLGDTIFPIWELPTSDLPDLHDGTLEDWEEVLPNSSLNHNDFVLNANPETEVDTEDLAFRVFLAWNRASQRIYMGIELIDDVYLTDGNGYTMLMLDGDHSGGQYQFLEEDGYSEEESRRLSNSQAQRYYASPQATGGRRLRTDTWLTWTVERPWGNIGGFQHGESPNWSAVELEITPWDDLDWHGPELSKRSVLEAGKIVGFQIAVLDFDGENDPLGVYLLPKIDGVSQSADNFVDGELIPCYRGDCSGATTGVSQDSWGCVKASFR